MSETTVGDRPQPSHDVMADAITKEIDRLSGGPVPAGKLPELDVAGVNPVSFRNSFTTALAKGATREKAITEALDKLKADYSSERGRLLMALEDTQRVTKALTAAIDVLSPATVEVETEPTPGKGARRGRKS